MGTELGGPAGSLPHPKHPVSPPHPTETPEQPYTIVPAAPAAYSSLGLVLSLVALAALLVAVVAVALCYRHRHKGKESRHLAVGYTAGQTDTSDYVVPGERGDVATAPSLVTPPPLCQPDACPRRRATKPPRALLLQPQLPHAVPVHAAGPRPRRPGPGQLPQGTTRRGSGSGARRGVGLDGASRCCAVHHGVVWCVTAL